MEEQEIIDLLWKRKDQQVLLSYYDTTKKYCCR